MPDSRHRFGGPDERDERAAETRGRTTRSQGSALNELSSRLVAAPGLTMSQARVNPGSMNLR